jgi:ABC-2 type transport system ATP-binding protein
LSETLLRARGVARRFGALVALEPTDIDVLGGESLALIGPNGAGKSTLLAILAGALEPSAGDVERLSGVRVGWVPQRPALYDRLTARENLELFARLEGRGDPAGLLVGFDIPPDRPAHELSVGNRQRLNVALALLGEPRVLLLDEPTASLDPGQRRRLWEIVTALRDDGGAVVFVTQNLEELDLHADRVVAMQQGRLVPTGVEEVYS